MKSILGSLLNKAPVSYTSTGFNQRSGLSWGRNSRNQQINSMGASAALFSIVNRTSTSVAKVDWHLHRKLSDLGAMCSQDGCEYTGVENVTSHPALSVLKRPNNFYTEQEFFESGQQHIDLTGEGWTAIYRMGKVPYELWCLNPARITVIENAKNFLIGYLYTDPDGVQVPIKKEDMLSIRMPNPNDPYRGMGPVQTILDEVSAQRYWAEYKNAFMQNGARPGAIVKIRANMTDDDFKQLVERFNEGHKGVGNVNRTAFLEEGEFIDVKPYTMADMQFVENAGLSRDTILLAYGMSKFAVGVLEDVNRAASEASKAAFAETITVPRLDRWHGMLNNDFLPQFPGYAYDLEFVYSNPVPADREADRLDKSAAVANYKILVDAGVDPDEAAAVCGLPPMAMRATNMGERVPA